MESCESCRFWLNASLNPICRRNPEYIIHRASDWCGKYQGARECSAETPAPFVPANAPPGLYPEPMSVELQKLCGFVEASEVAPKRKPRKKV